MSNDMSPDEKEKTREKGQVPKTMHYHQCRVHWTTHKEAVKGLYTHTAGVSHKIKHCQSHKSTLDVPTMVQMNRTSTAIVRGSKTQRQIIGAVKTDNN